MRGKVRRKAFGTSTGPESRFFYDPPPFVSLLQDVIAAPVFFPTKHMTVENISVMKIDLYCGSQGIDGIPPTGLRFTEWDSDTDGRQMALGLAMRHLQSLCLSRNSDVHRQTDGIRQSHRYGNPHVSNHQLAVLSLDASCVTIFYASALILKSSNLHE